MLKAWRTWRDDAGGTPNTTRARRDLTDQFNAIDPPHPKPALPGMASEHVVQLVAQEYAALRGEIQTALASQAAILSFGAAAVGLLLAAGAQLWTDEKIGAGLLYLMGVPATCSLAVVLFLGEQIRLTRTGYYIFTIEHWVNRTYAGDGKVLGWEHWGCIRRRGGDLEQRTRWVVGAVFTLFALGAAIVGFSHVYGEVRWLGIAALAVTFVATAGTLWLTYRLTRWIHWYRDRYGDEARPRAQPTRLPGS